jgi:hypothetical protein
LRTGHAALVGGRTKKVIPGIDRRGACQERDGLGEAAVVAERAKLGIGEICAPTIEAVLPQKIVLRMIGLLPPSLSIPPPR